MTRNAADIQVATELAPIVIKNLRLLKKVWESGEELDDILVAEVANAILQVKDDYERLEQKFG